MVIKASVIGTGYIARDHLACLKTLDNVRVGAVCDLSAVMAEATAEQFGVPGWFTDHREILSSVQPDVVHVEVLFCVDLLGEGGRHADPDTPHAFASMPGGPVADFVTHLAYLADGPIHYAGLWELLGRFYGALGAGEGPPISPRQITAVNRLVWELLEGEPNA